ncbi:MAG: class I SAM-dependent methyltransferase, partial [Terriglobia bacterium]
MKDRSERSNPLIYRSRKTGERASAEHGLKDHSLVSVDEGYGLWAETYDAGPNPLLSAEERTLKPLLPRLAGKVVLDVGCGTGRWLEKLLIGGALAGAGVDLSSAMLGVAWTKQFLQGRLAKGDCLALPFQPHAADLIICSFAAGHISSLETFARELAGAAKQSADVYVSDVHPEAYAKGWRTGFRHKSGRAEIVTFPHSTEALHHAFQARGFELCQFREAHLGEPEKSIFERAGKSNLFRDACK